MRKFFSCIPFTFLTYLSIGFLLLLSCRENNTELVSSGTAFPDPSQISLAESFSQSQYGAMHGLHWRYQVSQNLFSDLFCQYFATTSPEYDSDRYIEVKEWSDLCWKSFYGQAATHLKFVEKTAIAAEMFPEAALAGIWKTFAYHRMTDYWGPVVYSSFGEDEGIIKYDSQRSLYIDFFSTLDDAVVILRANRKGNSFAQSDLLFQGDESKWITFAETLRLRLAMRIKYVSPELAQQEAEKAVAAGVMTDNLDNAYITTTNEAKHPLTTITNWGEFRMSALMESFLKGYKDPRLGIYFSPSINGDSDGDGNLFEGLRNGQPTAAKSKMLNGNHSNLNVRWQPEERGGINPSLKVMSASEAYFLRAEGALEGWTMGGTPAALYTRGIEMSLTEIMQPTDPVVAAYLQSNATPSAADATSPPTTDIPVKFDEMADEERQLEQIITQKWIALFPDGWEAFSELRRTGYPKTYPRIEVENPDLRNDEIFRRLTFVDSEYADNPEGLKSATVLLKGADNNATYVWWDKK